MERSTSVLLENHFEDFVDHKVSAGRFKNSNEVIRAGLSLLEEEESKLVIFKEVIEEGFASGIAKNFNAKKQLEKLKSGKQKNG